jgi:hypothetical protein
MELEGTRRPPAPWIDSIRAQGRGEGGEDRRRKAGDLVLRNGTAGGLLSLRAESEVASHSSGEESKVLYFCGSTRGEDKWNILGVRTSHRVRVRVRLSAYVCRTESAGRAGRCAESPARRSMPPRRRGAFMGKEKELLTETGTTSGSGQHWADGCGLLAYES